MCTPLLSSGLSVSLYISGSDAGHDDVISLTWSWTSCCRLLPLSLFNGLRDRASATMSLPGAYSAVTLYRIRRINRRWHLRGVSCRSLVLTSATSGLWSVSALNDPKPTRYRSNFSQAQTMARHSFSIWAYLFSAGVRVREQYALT